MGKTTILEAIHYCISGKSFRTDKIQELISSGADYFYIELEFSKHGIDQKICVTCSRKEKQIVYNSTKLKSVVNLLGILQGVLLTPDDVALIKGEPALRRSFFDLQIAQTDPLYVHHMTRYKKAMLERNALLKSKKSELIDCYEYEMANAAAYIVEKRQMLILSLEAASKVLHQKLSQKDEILSLKYKSALSNPKEGMSLRDSYLDLLKKNRFKEFDFGFTLVGPHKDDLQIILNENEAKQFASEGQKRSVVASLKLGEWRLLSKMSELKPLMLIDDLGISLDLNRKETLIHHLQSLSQVFVTMTEPSLFFSEKSHLIQIT